MAKIHLDRLKKRYKDIPIQGETYSEIVKSVLLQNNENISNKMSSLSENKWKVLAKKIRPSDPAKRLVLPDLNEIVPKRAITILKSAEKGEMIRETLRDSLTRDLRNSLDQFSASGKDSYVRQAGKTAGRINPQLIKDFEKRIQGTFDTYTKKDKSLGSPENVHRIAVTEVRSAINNTKNLYTQKMIEKNPDIEARKVWIHNSSMSKEPRRGHQKLDGKSIGMNESFKVENWKIVKGRPVKTGVDMMKHPHDPDAPSEQVIQCNCDYDIIVSRRKG